MLAQVSDARSGDAADPAAQRDVRKAEAKLGDTVSDFAATYMELYAKTKKRSWMTDQSLTLVPVVAGPAAFPSWQTPGTRGCPRISWSLFSLHLELADSKGQYRPSTL